MQRVLAAVLVAVLLGCTSNGKQAETPPAPLNASTSVIDPEPDAEITSTPSPTVKATPVSTPTRSAEATSTPLPTPSPETIPPEECENAIVELLDAEAEALVAAAAIERYLTSPLARGVAAVPEGLPDPELDGSHVTRYQALAQTAGLTEMLLNEEGWAAVAGWQQAWAVAESFGDNSELWHAAAEAALAVSTFSGEHLQAGTDFPAGIDGWTELLATGVAEWRSAWFRALAATDPAEMVPAHAYVLDAAGNAFLFSTRGSAGGGVTDDQFTGPLEEALRERLAAARKIVGMNC